jgi:hypothetical protein
MKKWPAYTLAILVAFVVVAAVAGISYRIGLEQGALAVNPFPAFSRLHGFDKEFMQMGRNFHGRGAETPARYYGRGGTRFFSPVLSVLKLVFLGLILWIAYVLYKRSGWRFVRVDLPAQVGSSPPADNEKKKTRGKKKE